MKNTITTFGGLLQDYIARNNLSASELAHAMGVSPATVLKAVHHGINDTYSGVNVGDPSIDFIRRFSNVSGIDPCTCLHMIVGEDVSMPTEYRVLAQEISKLSSDDQRIIKNFIAGAKKKTRYED